MLPLFFPICESSAGDAGMCNATLCGLQMKYSRDDV